MNQRSILQKISLIVAVLSYLSAVAVVGLWKYYSDQLGTDHPISASLMASVVFFIGVGIVLHVIGKANLPDLSFSSLKQKPSR